MFAKYLPVDGKIKDGDEGEKNGIIIHYHSVSKYRPTPEEEGVQKVELFLCSDELEVGDKAYFTNCEGNSKHDKFSDKEFVITAKAKNVDAFYLDAGEEDEFGRIELYLPARRAFKIIAKISPEATWVNQNDIFTDDQVKLVYGVELTASGGRGAKPTKIFHFDQKITEDSELEYVADDWANDFGNWETVRIGWDLDNQFVAYAKIKGACGHFH